MNGMVMAGMKPTMSSCLTVISWRCSSMATTCPLTVYSGARAQADALKAVAAVVLHGGEQPRAKDANAHDFFCRLKNSARLMARKRMRSPGHSMLGRGRFASNSTIGVRPMTFQPPEIAYG